MKWIFPHISSNFQNNVYEDPLHSKHKLIKTTVNTQVTERYWEFYRAEIQNLINELEGDSGNDAEIDELENELT